jgi:hypothetical protein
MKKNHPDKYEEYFSYLDRLRKKESFEILTLISTVK